MCFQSVINATLFRHLRMYFYLYRYQHLKRSLGLKQERSLFTSKWNSLPFNFTQVLDRFSVHLFHASQFGLQCILVSCILVLSFRYQCFLAKTHFVSGKSVCFTVNRIRILLSMYNMYTSTFVEYMVYKLEYLSIT